MVDYNQLAEATAAADVRQAAYGMTIPTGDDVDAKISYLLAKAADRIVLAVPSVPRRMTAGTLAVATVAGVLEDMVIRILRNPDALRSITVDDGTAVLDRSIATGELYVSDTDRQRLAPPRRPGSARAITQHVPTWRLPHAR